MWASVRQGFWVLLDRFGRIWAILIAAPPLVAAYFSAIPENMPCSCGVGSTETSLKEIDHGREGSKRPQRLFLAPAAAADRAVGRGRETGGRGTKPPTPASPHRAGLRVTEATERRSPPMSKAEKDREAGAQPQPIALRPSETKPVAGGSTRNRCRQEKRGPPPGQSDRSLHKYFREEITSDVEPAKGC